MSIPEPILVRPGTPGATDYRLMRPDYGDDLWAECDECIRTEWASVLRQNFGLCDECLTGFA